MKVPVAITNELHSKFNIDIEAFQDAHNTEPPTSVRLNPLRSVCRFLTGNEQKVLWSDQSFYLNTRPVFTADPLFHAGCYYVQEASSMFVAEALKQTVDLEKKQIVLDACAAPGGKSTLVSSLLNDESLLVSNEVISTRVPVLVHNLSKWGTTNTLVTNTDPKDFSRLPDFFDVMVVDAPCSGSGLFRKQKDAVDHWSEENVEHCSLRQQRILHDLLPSLKENGILIYSTCSYSVGEDEAVCDQLMNEHELESIGLNVPDSWGIVESQSGKGAYTYRFFPHLAKGEGFFLACFRKGSSSESSGKNKNTLLTKVTRAEEAVVLPYLSSANIELRKFRDVVIGFHKHVAHEVETLVTNLKVKKFPVEAGEIKGRDFVPAPTLAYQNILSSTITRAELSEEDAMRFLRKQDFKLPEHDKGLRLATFQGYGLGWMKNLGNRINNYYPAEWRILRDEF